MKKLSKKSLLLFAAVLSLSAFAMPSMASATGWEPVGSTHLLTSADVSFNAPAVASGSICNHSTFEGHVVSTAVLTITTATFDGCTGTGTNGTGCTTTAAPTNLDWRATGLSTTNITIDGVNVDVRYSGTCALNGQTVRVTGALSGGTANNATHSVTYSADVGLTAHSALGSFAATVSGTFRDVQQTLIFAD